MGPGDWTLPSPAGAAWITGSPLVGWREVVMEPTGFMALTGVRMERGDWPLARSRLHAIPSGIYGVATVRDMPHGYSGIPSFLPPNDIR